MASFPLHKAGRGILGTLEQKVLGQNPDTFGRELVPVFDARDHYLTDMLAPIGPVGSIANPAVNALAGETCPTGEIWNVVAIQAQATVLAADKANTYWATINLTPPSAVVTMVLATGVMIDITAAGTGTRYFSLVLPHPLLLMPGWRLGVGVFASAAPAVSTAIAMIAMAHRIKE